ncbi:hypothetical protein GCM10025869_10990 [Homoserinibacter gongjuensis]|uniref:Uncharacterized protein n=1 Tax=Homoserinibacter gongjuensis TaxID=1162968 RepID=A0ABQ6JQI7_9MICO|nr:hypothetical protein GCM10025869_10990 [Homoserinibacter gongjuensis]
MDSVGSGFSVELIAAVAYAAGVDPAGVGPAAADPAAAQGNGPPRGMGGPSQELRRSGISRGGDHHSAAAGCTHGKDRGWASASRNLGNRGLARRLGVPNTRLEWHV